MSQLNFAFSENRRKNRPIHTRTRSSIHLASVIALAITGAIASGCDAEGPPEKPGCREINAAQQTFDFRRNPATGQCVPIDVTPPETCAEERTLLEPAKIGLQSPPPEIAWEKCTPACQGLSEVACIQTTNCSPLYASRNVSSGSAAASASSNSQPAHFAPKESPVPDQRVRPKQFVSCQPTAVVPPPCSSLNLQQCTARTDCEVDPQSLCDGPGCSALFSCRPKTPPAQSCGAKASEQACVADGACAPEYRGARCFCDANGCACVDYSYTRCTVKP